MKLLFTQDALNNGGAERSHLEILSRFSGEVDVSFVYFYPKYDLKEEYEKAGKRLIFLDIPESYHIGLAVSRLVKLIRSEKPDLLVSSLWRADIITRIAALLTGVPLIGTLVNDSYAALAWKDKKGFKYKVVYWLDRLTAGIPTHWIANAQALADSHVKTLGLDPKKISVVYRGREIPVVASKAKQSHLKDRFVRRDDNTVISSEARTRQSQSPEDSSPRSVPAPPSGGAPQTETTEIPISQQLEKTSPRFVSPQTGTTSKQQLETFRFLSYGRLLERKGFQDAIQAFAIVLQTYPNCTLTIYGEGPYRAELESLISKLELQTNIFLPGHISAPSALLYASTELSTRTAHCFIFPSWYEGFSGALIEAMMAGIPIIASDIPMNLEAVTHQNTALIYPVNKPMMLAEQMCFVIANPDLMAKLGEEARKVAVEKFSITKIAKDYEALLHDIYNSTDQQT